MADTTNTAAASRITAGLLAIFLGHLGVHQFYMKHNSSGIIRLCVSIVPMFVLFPLGILVMFVMSIIALIEGIKYLTMSDEQFQNVYIKGGKAWL